MTSGNNLGSGGGEQSGHGECRKTADVGAVGWEVEDGGNGAWDPGDIPVEMPNSLLAKQNGRLLNLRKLASSHANGCGSTHLIMSD